MADSRDPIPPRLKILLALAVVLATLLITRWISGWGLVTVHAHDVPLGKVLASIARQGHVRVESSLDPLGKATLDVDGVSPAEAMEILAANTGGAWRSVLLAAPGKVALESGLLSLRSGGGVDGWRMHYYPSPPFLDTGDGVIDPGQVAWTPEGPSLDLPSLLDEAAQKTGVMTLLPEGWAPSVRRLPAAGKALATLPRLVSSAGGSSLSFFYLTERSRRGQVEQAGGENPPPQPPSSGEGSGPGPGPGSAGWGVGRMAQTKPEWMAQRLAASARSLPKGIREKALRDVDELKPFLDQLKTLPPQERRDKMRELMANPAFAEKMADRMLARDSRRSADQRITRAVGYLNRKASAKASGQ